MAQEVGDHPDLWEVICIFYSSPGFLGVLATMIAGCQWPGSARLGRKIWSESTWKFLHVCWIGGRQKGGLVFCSELHGTRFLPSVKIYFFNSLHIWYAFSTSNKQCPTECLNLRHQSESKPALSPFLPDHCTVLMLSGDWIYT